MPKTLPSHSTTRIRNRRPPTHPRNRIVDPPQASLSINGSSVSEIRNGRDNNVTPDIIPEVFLFESEVSHDVLDRLLVNAPVEEISVKSKRGHKRKSEDAIGNSEKKLYYNLEPRCSVCNQYYDDLMEKNERLYMNKCGHLFCPCASKKGAKKKCNICGKKIETLRKIFL